MKRLLERRHHFENHVLVVVFLGAREIQIGRKSSLAADKHFPQTGAALEGQPVQNAALGEQLQQEREHDFLLRDHDVAEARIQPRNAAPAAASASLALLPDGLAPAESGAALQLFRFYIDEQPPRLVVADRSLHGARARGIRAEVGLAAPCGELQ